MNDVINAIFSFLSGIFLWYNCWKLYKDKQVCGVSISCQALFTLWGFWNLYYWPSLNQWVTWYASIFSTTANLVWVWMAIYYTRKKKLRSYQNE